MVVLNTSQKVRTVQCKDGNIFRKPSIRNQYVSGAESSNSNNNNNNQTTHKLEPQSTPQSSMVSMPSTSGMPQTNSSLRSNSRKNRQRQLEGLDRMEQRIRQLKASAFSPLPVRNATIKSTYTESTLNPMQLFALDISKVVEQNSAQWLQRNHYTSQGPEEVILYSLVAGRAELVMFGGIQKDKNMKQSQHESALNNIPDIVSNHLHIIKAKREII